MSKFSNETTADLSEYFNLVFRNKDIENQKAIEAAASVTFDKAVTEAISLSEQAQSEALRSATELVEKAEVAAIKTANGYTVDAINGLAKIAADNVETAKKDALEAANTFTNDTVKNAVDSMNEAILGNAEILRIAIDSKIGDVTLKMANNLDSEVVRMSADESLKAIIARLVKAGKLTTAGKYSLMVDIIGDKSQRFAVDGLMDEETKLTATVGHGDMIFFDLGSKGEVSNTLLYVNILTTKINESNLALSKEIEALKSETATNSLNIKELIAYTMEQNPNWK